MANNIFVITVLLIYSVVILKMYGNLKSKTKELENLNSKLVENSDKLQLILNSTAEAIYGLDKDGNCVFCNKSCLETLGYKHYDELLGKNMHLQIHHSYKDGKSMPIKECRIHQAILTGKGTHVDDEVFWTKDGKSFDVEYHSYPQFKDGEVIGAVVTFMDITEQKRAQEEIIYLSYHDALTGLYNRMFFNTELSRLDTVRNLPITIIIGDANGLKLTNDIFGHEAGDNLLMKIADAFKKICRADDIVARIGGDEFAVLLPNTTSADAQNIIQRVKDEISKEQILAIKASISMGCASKISDNQDILTIIKEAENKMYQEKTLTRNENNSSQIRTIIESLHGRYPKEELHSRNVSQISQDIGRAMKLTSEDIKKLKDAGTFHDLGKVVLSEKIINNGACSDNEIREYKQHSVIGYRILNSFDETLNLAEPVLSHHENWDGSGYPKGLKENEIPLLARIIAVADIYDSMTNHMKKNALNKEEALHLLKEQSGRKFDPHIVDVLISIIKDEN